MEASRPRRTVIHADLDAFYASVEQMDNPEFRGKPLLVGGRPDQRGVVAACSYEARTFGIRSAMPMRTAVGLCPEAVIVPPRFDRYREVSCGVMDILRSVTPQVQQMSIDEAYMDVSDTVKRGTSPVELARRLKERVRAETGLTISLGIAGSKAVAKIASDMDKPDGLTFVEPGTERAFLAPLPARKLNGIGPRTEEALAAKGVRTLGELAERSYQWLERVLGKRGPELGMASRGLEDRPVVVERVAKSISAEATLPKDIRDPQRLAEIVARLSERVGGRLERSGSRGKTVTLKLRLSDFTTFTRSSTLPAPTGDPETVREVAQRLLEKEMADRGGYFRLLGVGISNFAEGEGQLLLFDLAEGLSGRS